MATAAETRKWVDRNPFRAWRMKHDVSLMEASGRVGCGISTIQSWESGARQPTEEWFTKLKDLLDKPKLDISWNRWHNQRPEVD